jgi:hypothetical protein
MVEKVITPGRNVVVDFARYQVRRDSGKALAVSARICRHCGAALLDGESQDDCSSAFSVELPAERVAARKFYVD